MILYAFAVAATLICAAVGRPAAAAETAALPSALAAPIAAAVEGEIAAGRIPGAVVLVGRGAQIVYRGAFGQRALLPEAAPMAMDTIFDLASLTKVVATTPAVMQLVESRRLRLDAPVATYWPAFAANGKGAITVEDLLTHRSGLRPDIELAGLSPGQAEAALRRVEAEKPVHPRGTRFVYSDINFIALGELVRRITGEPLDVYAAKRIFHPLGMVDTEFRPAPELRRRIAPTDVQDGALRWGEVQDPTAFRMGGVAGHAGLFGTVDDLARFAQMLLGEGGAPRILNRNAVLAMTAPRLLPGAITRGLGWDIASPYTSGQDQAFGAGSYGHTGYTGTSLWIDPASRTYLIVLTNRLHPRDHGPVNGLRQRLAEIVAATLERPKVLSGIDVLAASAFAPLAGLRVGLVTNQAGRDAAGRRTIDLLAASPAFRLAAIFSPEHGLGADREGLIDSGHEPVTGLPLYSLYGSSKRPTDKALEKLDALVVDLQDVGVRFYTYATTMAYAMEAAARQGKRVFVLDRPNPINAAVVQGPTLDPGLRSFTGYFPAPVRHGMTLGEIARMFNSESGIGANLTVIPMQGYRRAMWYDETGLAWVNPSPNLRSLDAAALYPGVALVEGANVSVGRGTSRPFGLVGAPWIDGSALARDLAARRIPGVRIEATHFVPSADRYAGQDCGGISISLTDRASFDSPLFGIELASALHRLDQSRFGLDRTLGLIGSPDVIAAIRIGTAPKEIADRWQGQLDSFLALRAKYLIYR